MKLLIIAGLVVLCFGSFYLGARSSRPDLNISMSEELSMMRAEVALQASQHALAVEKDPAKIKTLAEAAQAKLKKDLDLGASIRKAHRCETCIIHWYLETDGSMALTMQTPAPVGGK